MRTRIMQTNRRTFFHHTALAVAAAGVAPAWLHAAGTAGIKVGACVVGLAQARQAGLDGVEVGVGGAAEQLDISKPEVRQRYKAQMAQTGLPICSLMMGLLNDKPLASDPRGPAWLDQSIAAAKDLGAKVILVAFFGNGDLLDGGGKVKEAALESVVKRLKEAAPRAKDAGVILAIENYLNAEQNARILDRINHEAVQLYYDVYNTGATKGYDVPKELRLLKGRVAQLHFKNGGQFLGEGKLKFEPMAAAIKEIGYQGFIVLETSSPTREPVADVRRNAEFTRKLFA